MIAICGRRVKVQTGAQSQTINICTPANINGNYDYIFRIVPPFLAETELLNRRFRSVKLMVEYLRALWFAKIKNASVVDWRSL